MNFFKKKFESCLDTVIESIKVLLYKRHPFIFERINFQCDEIYQEPILYAYLSQLDDKWLDSILYGYEKNRKERIDVFTNKQGIVYIPKVGYFKTEVHQTTLCLEHRDEKYRLLDINNNDVQFEFEPICIINNGVELVKALHVLLENSLDNKKDEMLNTDMGTIYPNLIDYFNNAFEIIKRYYSDYYSLLQSNVKKVMLFEGNINSFASMQMHNMIFLNVNTSDSLIFFLDHILHEGAHVLFNTFTFNTKDELFKIPYNSFMSEFTGNPLDTGELYERFHGLFTQFNINFCMNICIREKVFKLEEKHELLGRFVSNMKRFKLGVEKFNIESMYLEEGMEWYKLFSNIYIKLYTLNSETINCYDVSNQPYVFSYEIFKKTNYIQDYL